MIKERLHCYPTTPMPRNNHDVSSPNKKQMKQQIKEYNRTMKVGNSITYEEYI